MTVGVLPSRPARSHRRILLPAVLIMATLTACATSTTVADAGNPSGTDLLLPVTAPVTLTLGPTSGPPSPSIRPIATPLPDPVSVAATPDRSAWTVADGQLSPDVQSYADEFGIPVDEAIRQLSASQSAEQLFSSDPTFGYTVIEHDPFQFVVGTTRDQVAAPSSVGGYPVVVERPGVPPERVRKLWDLVSTALRGQSFGGSLDLRVGTVTVVISHDAAAAAIAGVQDRIAALTPAALVVQRSPQPVPGEVPADAEPLLRFPATIGGGSPAALAVGRLIIDGDGCVRPLSAPLTGAESVASPLALADYVDLIVTPDRILLDGIDLGRPGPDGPVLEMGGGYWPDNGDLTAANPGREHCIGSGDVVRAFYVQREGGITGGG